MSALDIRGNRMAWMLEHGRCPGPGMVVMHRCDTPSCLNPAHLRVGTHADNVADKVEKGRQAKGPTHGSRTKPESVPRTSGERWYRARGLTAPTAAEIAERKERRRAYWHARPKVSREYRNAYKRKWRAARAAQGLVVT